MQKSSFLNEELAGVSELHHPTLDGTGVRMLRSFLFRSLSLILLLTRKSALPL